MKPSTAMATFRLFSSHPTRKCIFAVTLFVICNGSSKGLLRLTAGFHISKSSSRLFHSRVNDDQIRLRFHPAAFQPPAIHPSRVKSESRLLLSQFNPDGSYTDDSENLNNISNKATIQSTETDALIYRKIIQLFSTSNCPEGSDFIPLSFTGIYSQTNVNSAPVDFILLSPPNQSQLITSSFIAFLQSFDTDDLTNTRVNIIPIPLSPALSSTSIQLLSHAYSSTPLSKTKMLSLNSIFINRDGGLFDNLPWSRWSIDPDEKERDAANNVVDEKFSMGKRVAFQRFMGKDWRRSLTLTRLSNQMRDLLLLNPNDGEREDEINKNGLESSSEQDMMASLSKRLLELEIKEARMEIAECEERLAILRTELMQDAESSPEYSDFTDSTAQMNEVRRLEEARSRFSVAESSLQDLLTMIQTKKSDQMSSEGNGLRSTLLSILSRFDEQTDHSPYHGAIGYPPKSSANEQSTGSEKMYSSPYQLLVEIINEQLNAQVVGCVLEPTSLLEGNLVLGGAVLLRRKGRPKSTILAGERVDYMDSEDDFGNEGVLPESFYVVECFSDEVIGLAIECGFPLFLERSIWERAGAYFAEIDVVKSSTLTNGAGATSVVSNINRLPVLRPVDELIVVSMEGDKVSSEKDANSIRIPLPTTSRIFEGAFRPSSPPDEMNSAIFSTFSPVNGLDEYDALTDDDKVRILLKLESFESILPRPRVVRESKVDKSSVYNSASPPSALDNILLPLIDEAIRRQYLIRDAERREDYETAERLRSNKSQRQYTLEQAKLARERGLEDEARQLEEDADLYKALRADFTQDEGAYSRFLDRDEWYEREAQARLKRLDKSKFGSLLDGVDLP